MRINEIVIDHKKAWFESLTHEAAISIANDVESMRVDTANFSKRADDVYFESDISDFLSYFETQSKKLSKVFDDSHQTTRILKSVIRYLRGQSV